MKCLEKDRTRRYETANGLVMDLKRHLANEPVLARPPSTLYRLQKLARRHKLAVAAAAAVVLRQLGEGNRAAALAHFEKSAAPRVFGFIDYQWSRLFLALIDRDPNWPPWLPTTKADGSAANDSPLKP